MRRVSVIRLFAFNVRTPVRHRYSARALARRSRRQARRGLRQRAATSSARRSRASSSEFAASLGARHAIGVANGTDALTLALRALGVGPGDEVIVPSFTFYASAEAIPPTGARPVFCDVDPETFCVTPETVQAAITPRTKAVIVVHLFGNVAPVAEIEALGVPVVEDAAQAAGALAADGRRAGSLGTIATFSFFPSKNLGAFGDGGAVVTSDDALDERVRMLRFHGSRDKESFELVGYNSRLDAMQAALLRITLPHLDRWCDGRRAAAAAYEASGLGEVCDAAAAGRGLHARVASVRRAPSAAGRARRRAQGGGDRAQGLLPRADPPPGGDARVRRRRPRAARHGRARPHPSRDPDEPGARAPSRSPRWRRPRTPWPRIECARCAAGSAPRPFPSIATPLRRSRWTPGWSRWPTSSPIAFASTGPAACPTSTTTCSSARSGSRSSAASRSSRCSGSTGTGCATRRRASTCGSRRRRSPACSRSSPTSWSCSRSCCSRRRAASCR